MRRSRPAFRSLAPALGAVLLLGCAVELRWLSVPPELPDLPPQGHAIHEAALVALRERYDGRRLPPNPESARGWVRLLRRTGVFTGVEGIGPEPAPDRVRVEIETDAQIDPLDASNLVRSVFRGASFNLLKPQLPYRVALTAALRLRLRLPGSGELREYAARTQASRGYWDNRDYPAVLGTLHQEVSAVNLRNVLAQLRADASLTAAPAPRSGALVAPGPAPVP